MDLIGPTSQTYISQRTRLHYADWGNHGAPPLILLHGGRDHRRSRQYDDQRCWCMAGGIIAAVGTGRRRNCAPIGT